MYRYETEEEMKMLLQNACKPVQIPQDFKSRLYEQLVSNIESKEISGVRHLWGRPKIMVPVMASITGGLIGYGVWASWNLAPAILP